MATMSRSVPVASTIYSSGRSNARGLCIIVTNDYTDHLAKQKDGKPLRQLKGPEIDGIKMKEALETLDFTVHWENNIDKRAFLRLITDLKEFPDYSKLRYETNCIIFIFSGHGDTGDTLYLQDGSLKMETIY